jgi:hypothetical protein
MREQSQAEARGTWPRLQAPALPWLLVALAATAWGQDTPASIQVAGERTWVLAGRTLGLQAWAVGEFGELLPGVEIQWASSNPSVARVSTDGAVSGLLPGRVTIEASAGGVSGQFPVWVHAARIEITPARVELEIGGRATLSARALDADGRPLAGSAFTWYSSLPSVASLDSGGVVRAVASGTVTITARLNVPEGGLSFTGQAQAIVRPRPPYRADRLISSDSTSLASVRAIHQLDYSNDRFVFSASLSNGSQAAMMYDRGRVRKLIASGDPSNGGTVSSVSSVAINSHGDVVVMVGIRDAPGGALFIPYDRPLEPHLEREPERRCCMSVAPGALADNGEFVFSVWYHEAQADELYISRPGDTAVRIPTENLPGFGRGVWMRDRARMTGPGQVVFGAGASNAYGVFLWDGRQMSKLAAQNETVLGFTNNWIENRIVTGAAGDVYVLFNGPGCMAARWSSGAWSKVLECGQQFPGDVAVHGIHWLAAGRDGAILFEGNINGMTGRYVFASGQLRRLGSSAIERLRQGFLRADGDVVAVGSQGTYQNRISQIGTASGESILYETGRPVDFSTAVTFDSWLNGAAGAGGKLITRTASSALARIGQDAAQILLSPGDALADGGFVDWISETATAPNGDVLVSAGSSQGPRLFLYRQQGVTEIHGASNPLRGPGGEDVDWFSGRLAINNRGQMAAQIRFRDPSNGNQFDRVVLFSESDRQVRVAWTPGIGAPGGGTIYGPEEMVLDDQGRLWFIVRPMSSAKALFVWDNGVIRRVYSADEALPDGRRPGDIYRLQHANGRVYFSSWFPDTPNAFLEAETTRVRYAVSHLTPTSFGGQINWFHNGGQFRVGPNGEIAYLAWLSGPNSSQALLIRKPDGTDVVVARQYERTGDTWIDSLTGVAWNNDGRLFFTASVLGAGRLDLFLATAQ